jgi:AcrR family transcriptional regulator
MRGRRPRSGEELTEKRATLVRAARALLCQHCLQEITISQIAQAAQMAKGTTYLYFRTREEVFLALLLEELDAWELDLGARLQPQRALTPEGAAALLTGSLRERTLLLRLLGFAHAVLEQNLSDDVALQFKRRLLGLMTRLGELLEERCAGMGAGQGAQVLLRLHMALVGLSQMAAPSASGARALRCDPALRLLAVDVERELQAILLALLRGCEGALAHSRPSST